MGHPGGHLRLVIHEGNSAVFWSVQFVKLTHNFYFLFSSISFPF
jgi:hypothetical protein